jgi:hypothetical protein
MSSSGAIRYSDIALAGIVVYRLCLEIGCLVASFGDGARNAKLSLQQTEILSSTTFRPAARTSKPCCKQ